MAGPAVCAPGTFDGFEPVDAARFCSESEPHPTCNGSNNADRQMISTTPGHIYQTLESLLFEFLL